MLILNAAVLNGKEPARNCGVRVRDGRIAETGTGLRPEAGETVKDLGGDFLLP